MLNGYWLSLSPSSQHTATHAPGSERHTRSLVHPRAQVTEIPHMGHPAIAIMHRAPQSTHASHPNFTLASVDCQAFVIGIPQASVHLRLDVLLACVNNREVTSKEQMRDISGPRLPRSTLYNATPTRPVD
jgi:hypothetical protein